MGKTLMLLDVDHSFLLGDHPEDDGALNMNIIKTMHAYNIKEAYLFSDMLLDKTLDRYRLIQVAAKYGIKILGIITPCDLFWNTITVEDAKKFYEYNQKKNRYFDGRKEAMQECINANLDLKSIAIAAKNYSPGDQSLGLAYRKAEEDLKPKIAEAEKQRQEIELKTKRVVPRKLSDLAVKPVAEDLRIKAIVTKTFTDFHSYNYPHPKGLMLDMVLCNFPDSDIIVIDDNEKVKRTVNTFAPVSPIAALPKITMIHLPAKGRDDLMHYTQHMEQHYGRETLYYVQEIKKHIEQLTADKGILNTDASNKIQVLNDLLDEFLTVAPPNMSPKTAYTILNEVLAKTYTVGSEQITGRKILNMQRNLFVPSLSFFKTSTVNLIEDLLKKAQEKEENLAAIDGVRAGIPGNKN